LGTDAGCPADLRLILGKGSSGAGRGQADQFQAIFDVADSQPAGDVKERRVERETSAAAQCRKPTDIERSRSGGAVKIECRRALSCLGADPAPVAFDTVNEAALLQVVTE